MAVARGCSFRCSIRVEVNRIGPSRLVSTMLRETVSSITPAALSKAIMPALLIRTLSSG